MTTLKVISQHHKGLAISSGRTAKSQLTLGSGLQFSHNIYSYRFSWNCVSQLFLKSKSKFSIVRKQTNSTHFGTSNQIKLPTCFLSCYIPQFIRHSCSKIVQGAVCLVPFGSKLYLNDSKANQGHGNTHGLNFENLHLHCKTERKVLLIHTLSL